MHGQQNIKNRTQSTLKENIWNSIIREGRGNWV